MSRLVGNKTVTLDLGKEEFFTLKAGVPFSKMSNLLQAVKRVQAGDDTALIQDMLPFLKEVVLGGKIRDENDNMIEFKPEMIDKLDAVTVKELVGFVSEAYATDPKS